MDTDFKELYYRHNALIQQKHTEKSSESLIKKAEKLIEELLEAERVSTDNVSTDNNVRQRLRSYATYWRTFVFEETGNYPKIKSPLAINPLETTEQLAPTIAILTTLPIEYVAIKLMLENQTEYIPSKSGGTHRYLIGSISSANIGHHIVVLSLIDTSRIAAESRVFQLLELFPKVDSIILTGIAGGIPNPDNPNEDVRLGDVVISGPNGIIEVDFLKEHSGELISRISPRPPSAMLLEGVSFLKASEIQGKRPWLKYIEESLLALNITRPSQDSDPLIDSTDPKKVISRPMDVKRRKGEPRIFVGPIAMSNKLLKSSALRNSLRKRFGVKALEMEGSGIALWASHVGYLVIRGICDYGDSRKFDDWQGYAAVVAAAYTRALLESIPTDN